MPHARLINPVLREAIRHHDVVSGNGLALYGCDTALKVMVLLLIVWRHKDESDLACWPGGCYNATALLIFRV